MYAIERNGDKISVIYGGKVVREGTSPQIKAFAENVSKSLREDGFVEKINGKVTTFVRA